MARSQQVPKFGNWESEENVPYTAYFDNARKGKSGSKKNPDDSEDNLTAIQQEAEPKGRKGQEAVNSKHQRRMSREDGELRGLTNSPLHSDTVNLRAAIDLPHQRHGGVRSRSSKSESEEPKGPDALRSRHERRPSREEDDSRRPTDSPLRHDAVGRKATVDSPHHRHVGIGTTVDSPHHRHGGIGTSDGSKRGTRHSVGSDRSIEQSPLHQHHQARVGNKGSGVSSPSWERKGSAEGTHGLAPTTPGRSRLRSVTRGDETPDSGPAVPKFGGWDENDPASGEGYTHIFNRVREERQSAGKGPVVASEASYSNGQKRYGNENSKGCLCFPWGRR